MVVLTEVVRPPLNVSWVEGPLHGLTPELCKNEASKWTQAHSSLSALLWLWWDQLSPASVTVTYWQQWSVAWNSEWNKPFPSTLLFVSIFCHSNVCGLILSGHILYSAGTNLCLRPRNTRECSPGFPLNKKAQGRNSSDCSWVSHEADTLWLTMEISEATEEETWENKPQEMSSYSNFEGGERTLKPFVSWAWP